MSDHRADMLSEVESAAELRSAAARRLPSTADGKPGPCVVVIFGASGDLTRRKLIPALYHLVGHGLLHENSCVLGVARRPKSDESFREELRLEMEKGGTTQYDAAEWEKFQGRISYCQTDLHSPEGYAGLRRHLEKLDAEHGTGGNYLFYLSVPPDSFNPIVQGLAGAELLREEDGRWRRVIVEKPFGRDLQSSRALNRDLSRALHEHQIYRIDHYLGKETVQNLLVFRFGNGIFEPIWNRRYVDHVQITVAESIGIEGRGSFYEQAGALRDVMQNHVFMLLSLIAMEPPVSLGGESLRSERAKALEAIRPMTAEQIARSAVRGQYGSGVLKGQTVPAYREEEGVDPNSNVETFAALRLEIENWRWAGVPFYLRTGKRLGARSTEIVVQFREAPLLLFGDTVLGHVGPNRLLIHIQPCEGITLQVRAKTPGPTLRTQAVKLDFNYEDLGVSPATGYETLLYDCMNGDPTLFHRIDAVEAAWKIATPILDYWNSLPPESMPIYPSGSWGPEAAHDLMMKGRYWWKAEC